MVAPRQLIILLLLAVCLAPSAPPLAEYHFGFSMVTSANTGLGTFYVVKSFEGQAIEHIPITRDQFVLQSKGLIHSKANAGSLDLFEENGLSACQTVLDPYQRNYIIDCSVLDNVWRLRFDEYPLAAKVKPIDTKGWSAKPYVPSERQWKILEDYGFQRMDLPFYGENAWRLLRDMTNPSWVDHYRGTDE